MPLWNPSAPWILFSPPCGKLSLLSARSALTRRVRDKIITLEMNSGFSPKPLVALFCIVAFLYFVAFYGLEYARQRKGPWEVAFQTDARGNPTLAITQPALGLRDVKIVFHEEKATNSIARVAFDRPLRPLPFGKVIYEDLTFLPGVVTFDLFGHEIELLPRILIANKKEMRWSSGVTLDLWPTNKPAEPPKRPRGGRP